MRGTYARGPDCKRFRVRNTLTPDLGNASEGKLLNVITPVWRDNVLEPPLLAPSRFMQRSQNECQSTISVRNRYG